MSRPLNERRVVQVLTRALYPHPFEGPTWWRAWSRTRAERSLHTAHVRRALALLRDQGWSLTRVNVLASEEPGTSP